jgi:PTH2 family peptidyl-tRNA hydrolase
MYVPNNLQQQQKQKGGEWLSGSFKPENFIPGLIIGFICGFLIDLSKPTTNHLSNKILSSSKLQHQLSVSSNAYQDLKMVCSFYHHFLKFNHNMCRCSASTHVSVVRKLFVLSVNLLLAHSE